MPHRTVFIRLAAVIATAACVSACGDKPTPAASAPTASAASVVAAPPVPAKQQAMTALMSLPELKAWSARIEKDSGGKLHGALIEYDPAPKLVNGKRYWQFSFVENGSDAARPWESFLVSDSGDQILVDDPAGDQPLTLDQWRKQKHPLERTGSD